MIDMSILNAAKITRVSNAVAAGTTAVNLTSVDMSGYENATLLVSFGTITATAVTSIKLQESDDNSTFSDLAGSAVVVADTQSNNVAVVEIAHPNKRYVRGVVVRGTANAVVDGASFLQYGAKKVPVTQSASVVTTSKVVFSPIAGTA